MSPVMASLPLRVDPTLGVQPHSAHPMSTPSATHNPPPASALNMNQKTPTSTPWGPPVSGPGILPLPGSALSVSASAMSSPIHQRDRDRERDIIPRERMRERERDERRKSILNGEFVSGITIWSISLLSLCFTGYLIHIYIQQLTLIFLLFHR